jgi:iron(III) transport system substrate-binding protein
MIMKRLKRLSAILLVLAFAACSHQNGNTVRVYTSMFPETIELFKTAFKQKYPDIDVQWYQNGSENIAAKLATEEMAGNIQADVVLTADIFWFRKMADQGFFAPHKATLSYDIPDEYEDKDGRFTTPRVSVMVIGYNKQHVSDADAPKSWAELADPKWKGKISSGSPLESGTNYSLMVNFAYKYGYDFLKKLRANDLMSAGGNSAVMQRMVTGERPVGMILLENALNEQKRNPNIAFTYPSDGAVIIPGPMGLTKASKNPAAAEKIHDFFLSPEGQKISLSGAVHVVDPEAGAPTGAKSLVELRASAFEISDKFYEFVKNEQEDFKAKYSDIMFQ